MPPIGTKNLGLIKAIHVGVNPPLNVKILWYNDSTSPYTTGPAKVHYYYDVIVADWMPLGAGIVINGIFTYIAFATSCVGADFSLSFDANIHCYWAIITSSSAIANVDLVPLLFEDRWTKFCRCGGASGSGNYTYIGYADSCSGDNFGESLQYEVDCDDCKLADTFLTVSGNSSFAPTNLGDGVEIVLTNVTPGQQLILDVKMNGALPLDNLIDYCVSISTLPNFDGKMDISLGDDIIHLDGPTSLTKQTIQNQGSQLLITIPNIVQPAINSTITIKIGTSECCSEEVDGKCYKCRCYFGIITSDTPIDTLTPEMFENNWIDICCDDSGADSCCDQINILNQQIENVNELIQNQNITHNQQINNLNQQLVILQQQLTDCCNDNEQQMAALKDLLNSTVSSMNESIEELRSTVENLEGRVDELEGEVSGPAVLPKIASGVTEMINDSISAFIETDYNPNRATDLEYSDTLATSSKNYTDTKFDSLNENLGITNDNVSSNTDELKNHEDRIKALEPR